MGYSVKSIPFFTDEITIWPHTVRSTEVPAKYYLSREVYIREFCDGLPCSLEQIEETGEYIVRLKNGDFIHGPEV